MPPDEVRQRVVDTLVRTRYAVAAELRPTVAAALMQARHAVGMSKHEPGEGVPV